MLHGFGIKPFTSGILVGESDFDSTSGCARKGDVVTMEQTSRRTTEPDGILFPAVITNRIERDRAIIVAMRGDNTGPHTMENARRKAYTAMTFKQTTTEYAKKWNDGNPVVRAQVMLPSIIPNPGGVPIKAGNEVIGGVGVSGSPGVDEDCVNAGLAKVADQLK